MTCSSIWLRCRRRLPALAAAAGLLLFGAVQQVAAQTLNALSYPATIEPGSTLEDMSSGTTMLIGAGADDLASTIWPIGFEFWYRGTRYTHVSVNANGMLKFGNQPIAAAVANVGAFNFPGLAALSRNGRVGPTGKVHVRTIGTAPNRRFVVEWAGMQTTATEIPGATSQTFQAALHETTGFIDLNYVTDSGATGTWSAGLADTPTNFATVNFNTADLPLSAINYTGGTANTETTDVVPAGTRVRFRPGAVTNPVSNLTYSGVSSTGMTLNWTLPSPLPAFYATEVYRSEDGGATYEYFTRVTAPTNTLAVANLGNAQPYTWKIAGITEGLKSADVTATTSTLAGTFAAGTYNIPGDFATITAAFNAIQTNGLAGNVTLELTPSYVSTGETFPIVVPTVASRSARITLRPRSDVAANLTISSTITNDGIFSFRGSSYVTIDGRPGGAGTTRRLVVTNASNGTGAGLSTINFASAAGANSNNTITWCELRSAGAGLTNAVVLMAGTTGTIGGRGNVFTNNVIGDGATTPSNGMILEGPLTPTTPQQQNTGTLVKDNLFEDIFAGSITSNGLSVGIGMSDVDIDGNRFFQTASRTTTVAAQQKRDILIVGTVTTTVVAPTDIQVRNNVIGFATATGTGTYTLTGSDRRYYPIQTLPVGSTGSLSITNNTIQNISLTSTNNSNADGGVLSAIHVQGFRTVVSGNTIGSTTTAGNILLTGVQNSQLMGISSQTPQGIVISNNTIAGLSAIGNAATAGPGVAGIAHRASGNNDSNYAYITNNTIGSSTAGLIANTSGVGGGAGTTIAAGIRVAGIDGSVATWTTRTRGEYRITGNTITNLLSGGSAVTVANGGGRAAGIIWNGGVLTITDNTISNITSRANATNDFRDIGVAGIYVHGNNDAAEDQFNNVLIARNTVSNLTANPITAATVTAVMGIGFEWTAQASRPTSGHVIERNLVHSLKNTSSGVNAPVFGIALANGTTTVRNNMVRLGIDETGAAQIVGTLRIVGVQDGWGGQFVAHNVHHNTVWIGGTGVSTGTANTYAYAREATTALVGGGSSNVRNNIFENQRQNSSGTGRHVSIRFAGGPTFTDVVSNNNVVVGSGTAAYAAGATGVIATPTFHNNLFTNWAATTQLDLASNAAASRVLNPTAGTPNLRIDPALGTGVEGRGAVIATVTEDFDGDVRSGLTPVDIGADAGNFTALDLEGPSITFTLLADTQSLTGRSLTATITDATGVASAGNAPRLYYRKSGDPTYVFDDTPVQVGNDYTWDMDYALVGGGSVAAGDIVQYYVAAQDTAAPTVGSSPSGALGTTPPGTIATVSPASYRIVAAPLSGDYVVGPTGAFTTLTAAATAFNERGVSAPVRLLLAGDYVSTGETFPITFNRPTVGPAPTSANTVTIKPDVAATGRTITGSSSAGLVVVNGFGGFIIDGSNTPGGTTRDLTLINSASGTGNVLNVLAGSQTVDTIAVRNANLRAASVSVASPLSQSVIFIAGNAGGSGGAISNVTIENNRIDRARTGLFVAGIAPGSVTAVVSGNTMNSASPNAIADRGIVVSGFDGVTISQNAVGNFSTTESTADRGIWVTGTSNAVSITRNRIDNINNTNFSGFGAWGIAVSTGTSATPPFIANNMITRVNSRGFSLTGGTDFAESDNGLGIALFGNTTGARLYNNTVFLSGNTQTTGASIGICLNAGSTADLRNNIVHNRAGAPSGAPLAVGVWMAGGASQLLADSDRNLYFVDAAAPATRVIARVGSTNHTTLAAYQGAVSGREATSISANPLLTSTTDASINSCISPAANAGLDLTAAGITADIDGVARPFGPGFDIGADESAYIGDPTAQPTALTSPAQTPSSIDLSWTAEASANGYVVLAVAGATPPSDVPADGTNYTAGGSIGAASVVFTGTATTATHSGLAIDSEYSYAVFAYTEVLGCRSYRTASPLTGTFRSAFTSVVAIGNTSANEGDATISFPLTINPANPTAALTVSYTINPGSAVQGADFSGPLTGSVVVPIAAATSSIDIPLVDDSIPELSRTMSVTLTGVTGGPSQFGTTTGFGSLFNDDSVFTGGFFAIDSFNPSTLASPNKALKATNFPLSGRIDLPHPGPNAWSGGDFQGNDFTKLFAFKSVGTSPTLTQTLWYANPDTAAETAVGGDASAIPGTDTVRGLAWDRSASRMVALYGSTAGGWSLGSVNTTTGDVTPLGAVSGLPVGADVHGPAANPLTGALFVVDVAGTSDTLYTINPTTFAASAVGATGVDHAVTPATLAYVDGTGVLAFFAREQAGLQTNKLYTLNLATGAATEAIDLSSSFTMGQTTTAAFLSAVHRLEVATAGGDTGASPAIGGHLYAEGQVVTLSNTNITPVAAGTRRVTTGWTGTGSVPATGSANTVAVTFTEVSGASSITWQRGLEHEVTLNVNNPAAGSWTTTPGFRAEGSGVLLEVTVNSGFQLDSITDESSATIATASGFLFTPLNTPKTFTANFSVVTNVADWQVLE